MPLKAPLDDLDATCKFLFNLEITAYQKEILEAVLVHRYRKVTVRAATRAGKSFATAMLAILYATFRKNKKVGIMAPTYDKARIIMDYIAELLNASNLFEEIVMLDTVGLTRMERLRKEVSKKKITFRNGSSIEIKSVDLSITGLAIMGFAYDLNIIEESAEIDDASFTKIYRMLVEHPDAQLYEIGNPWFLNHFYAHHNSDDWHVIHITDEDCVKAGRITRDALNEQKAELTDIEYQVLFKADFPTELEFSIFSEAGIQSMVGDKLPNRKYERIEAGLDIARGGRDRTLLTFGGVIGTTWDYLEHVSMNTRDTMAIVGQYRETAAKYQALKLPIHATIDTVNNAGVHDRLKELEYDVSEFIAGNKARDEDRFFNLKTETAFAMAAAGKEGRIKGLPPTSRYVLELRSWIYEIRSDRKLKIVDPEDKSPDFADSLLYACSGMLRDRSAERIISMPLGSVYPKMHSLRSRMIRGIGELRGDQ